MATIQDAHELLQLLELSQQAVRTVISEWAKKPPGERKPGLDLNEDSLPSRELFDARRTLIAATGKFVELVHSPSERLLEVSSQYNEARCLHLAASLRIANILDAGGPSGVSVKELSAQTGIQTQKLGRVMRCLCSIHVFKEVKENVFANNHISAALVNNEPLRAYIVMFAWDLYSASDALPRTLLDPEFGNSYSVTQTAFQKALETDKMRWNWLEEETSLAELRNGGTGKYPGPFGPEVSSSNGHLVEHKVKRPEHGIFGLAMLGGGRITGVAHLFDFPWASLGEATVVDVGGGVGGFCIQLSRIYPDLKFIVQDRKPVLEQARSEVWPKENPAALETGRVDFVTHDFFDKNPTEGADVYWLRYILHDWSDDYCVQILSAIRESMGPQSRILICDQVMNTTIGFENIEPAPSPLPANYGYYIRYSHQRDIAMMSIINGIERTPAEFKNIVERAGLRISRIYDCRSQVSLVECTLP